MRILALVAGTLFMMMLAYSGARIWADGQIYTPFKTEFFQKDGDFYILPWEQAYLLEKKADLILWVDVYRNTQGEILVKPWADVGKRKQDLPQEPTEARPRLRDLFFKYPEARWVINCDDNTYDIQLGLSQIVQDTQSQARVLVQSNYNTILDSLKELQPMLLYGSSIADITRLKTFQAMWLLPAAPFKGDVLMTPLRYLNRETVNAEIVGEMKRRFKKVILGPIRTAEDLDVARSLKPDGIFLADPFLLGPGSYQ